MNYVDSFLAFLPTPLCWQKVDIFGLVTYPVPTSSCHSGAKLYVVNSRM